MVDIVSEIGLNVLGAVVFGCVFYLFLPTNEKKSKQKRNALIAGVAYLFVSTIMGYLF